jgi:hypothetical protein
MFGLGSPRFPRWIDYSYPSPILLPAASAPAQVPGLTAQLVQPLPTLSIPGQWQFTVSRPQTDYVIYDSGGVPISRSSDNHVRNTFHGPYPGAAIGDLPAGEDWIADYEWGGKDAVTYNILERVTHRKGYGRYAWASYTWRSDGNYTTPTAASQTTNIVPLTAPVTPIQKVF